MGNHKLVTVSVFFLLKHKKDAIFCFFMKIYLENFLGSDRMHENKIYFLFLKGKINLKVLRFF